VLGVSWGSTMRAVVDALPHLAECTVVQVAGGLPGDPGDGAAELVRRVAGRTSGEVYQLHAPLFVGDAATAARLRAEPQILRTTAMFPRLTKLIVGLGSWGPDTPVAGALAAEDLRALEAASPRAELCGLFIGRRHDHRDPTDAPHPRDLTRRASRGARHDRRDRRTVEDGSLAGRAPSGHLLAPSDRSRHR